MWKGFGGDYYLPYIISANPVGGSTVAIDLPPTVPAELMVEEFGLDLVVQMTTPGASFQFADKSELDAFVEMLIENVNISATGIGTLVTSQLGVTAVRDRIRHLFGRDIDIRDADGDPVRVGVSSSAVTAGDLVLKVRIPLYVTGDSWAGRLAVPGLASRQSVFGSMFACPYGALAGVDGGGLTVKWGPLTTVSLNSTVCTFVNMRGGFYLLGDTYQRQGGGTPLTSPMLYGIPITRTDDNIRASTDNLTLDLYRSDLTLRQILNTQLNVGGVPAWNSQDQWVKLFSSYPGIGDIDSGVVPLYQPFIERHRRLFADLDWRSGGLLTSLYGASNDPTMIDTYGMTLIGAPYLRGPEGIVAGLPQVRGVFTGSAVKTGSSTLVSVEVQPVGEIPGAPTAQKAKGGTVASITGGTRPDVDDFLAPYLPRV